ncbi:hypothetical protein KDD93_01145 [Campylobacter sp. faydin G-24]|uniref:Cytochrome c domain-containing protein n=1 Tax=Campylobacter anatolicus TaxID=2829105 RepID=A0ABS5HFY5_9BACT|nr:hypothetical protein [Campylobacter anatolicus]MBR8463180.1 hypothetical protein [Campylobacter anatolicus]
MRKFLALAILSSALFAADIYVGAIAPMLDKIGGKEIATLHIGAKVKELSLKGEYAQIEYQGFVPEGSTISYARLGILEQDLQANSEKSLKLVKKVMDEYDNEWQIVSIKGFVKKDALTPNIDEIYARGEDLFKNRCGGCHALHGYDEFNVNVWPSVVETMIGNSALTPDEFEEVVRFLQSKAPTE